VEAVEAVHLPAAVAEPPMAVAEESSNNCVQIQA